MDFWGMQGFFSKNENFFGRGGFWGGILGGLGDIF